MSWKSITFSILIIVLCVFIGWTLGSSSTERVPKIATETLGSSSPSIHSQVFSDQKPSRKTQPTPKGAIPNERIISFKDLDSLNKFIQNAERNGLQILSAGHRSKTARVKFRSFSNLSNSLPDDADLAFNFPVLPPTIEEGTLNPNAVGFNGAEKEWLAVPADNAHWGEGVSVAVIDTGIADHSVFGDDVTAFSLVEMEPGTPLHPHGTAMASLWRTGEGLIPAVAPGVDLMSIQVANGTGISNLQLITEAIYLAVDEGADVIAISMGSTGTNSILEDAISYAVEHDTLIVAAAGNNGNESLIFPAANPNVISTTAVDLNRNYPGFPNTGEEIDIALPGYSIITADSMTGGIVTSTGTSPATQLAAAVIVGTMTELEITDPYEASRAVLDNVNDLGTAGDDTIFGEGYPQLDVILSHEVSGIYDGAIPGALIVTDEFGNSQVALTLDNPGTEDLSGANITITTLGQTYEVPVETISPKNSIEIILPISTSGNTESITVQANLTLPTGVEDSRPDDNFFGGRFTLEQ